MTELSKAFDITNATIPIWSAEFAYHLSFQASPACGKKRGCADEDGWVLALVTTMPSRPLKLRGDPCCPGCSEVAASAAGDNARRVRGKEGESAMVTRLATTVARF